jgi:hypothetical protein
VLFAGFAGFIASIYQRRLLPLLLAIIVAVIVFPLMVLGGFGPSILDAVHNNLMISRQSYEQLVFGLFLADSVQVFESFKPLRWMFESYNAFRPHLNKTTALYEWPGIFLTLVILSSPLILVATGALQRERSRSETLVYFSAAFLVFGILFSINGGLGYYFNLLVAPSIRAQARIMPFLSFCALVIVLTGTEWLLDKKTLIGNAAAVATVSLLTICMVPTVGTFAKTHNELMARPVVQSNIESAKKVLSAKDSASVTTVLLLPHLSWPERAIKGFDVYSLLSYFLLDHKGSQTRWSYGGTMKQPSFLVVKDMVESHADAGLSDAAIGMGFDAILVEKKAYQNGEWKDVMANINASPNHCKIYEDELRVMFSLQSKVGVACLN